MTEVNPIKLAGCIQGELAELCPESTIEVTYHELCLRHTLNAMTEEERAAVPWDRSIPLSSTPFKCFIIHWELRINGHSALGDCSVSLNFVEDSGISHIDLILDRIRTGFAIQLSLRR